MSWNCRRNKWVAQIKKHQKLYFLGYFDDERDAARAYDDKAVDIFGEFARLNDVEDDEDDDDASVTSEEP